MTLKPTDNERIAGGKIEPDELVRMAFEFLLENEPKESILGSFDLPLDKPLAISSNFRAGDEVMSRHSRSRGGAQ